MRPSRIAESSFELLRTSSADFSDEVVGISRLLGSSSAELRVEVPTMSSADPSNVLLLELSSFEQSGTLLRPLCADVSGELLRPSNAEPSRGPTKAVKRRAKGRVKRRLERPSSLAVERRWVERRAV